MSDSSSPRFDCLYQATELFRACVENTIFLAANRRAGCRAKHLCGEGDEYLVGGLKLKVKLQRLGRCMSRGLRPSPNPALAHASPSQNAPKHYAVAFLPPTEPFPEMRVVR